VRGDIRPLFYYLQSTVCIKELIAMSESTLVSKPMTQTAPSLETKHQVTMDDSTREQIKFMRTAVGMVLIVFGSFNFLVGIGFAFFTDKDGPYIGTNGLLVWSVIMVAFGLVVRLYRSEDSMKDATHTIKSKP